MLTIFLSELNTSSSNSRVFVEPHKTENENFGKTIASTSFFLIVIVCDFFIANKIKLAQLLFFTSKFIDTY